MSRVFIPKGLAFPLQFSSKGHLARARGSDKLAGNLQTIVLSELKERLMNPGFGGESISAVFGHVSDSAVKLLEAVTREAIARHEPRVTLVSVQASKEDSAIRLNITFFEKGTPTLRSVSFALGGL